MRVYDVEVLDVTIGDDTIAKLLGRGPARGGAAAPSTSPPSSAAWSWCARLEETKQRGGELQAASRLAEIDTRLREVERQRELRAAEVRAEAALDRLRETHEARCATRRRSRRGARRRARPQARRADAENERERPARRARPRAPRRRGARGGGEGRRVSPDLVAALQAFSDRALAERMAESMAPLAILGGESVSDVLGRLLQGTPLARTSDARITGRR
jgi:major vault protein